MKANRVNGFKTIGAFVLGATTGSAVALLYAPATGRSIRKRIGMKFRSLEHSTARRLNRTRKALAQKVGSLREVAEEKLGTTRQWFKEHALNGKRPLRDRRLAHHA